MGQYYECIFIDENECYYCIRPVDGAKLMEHSYVETDTMRMVENVLRPGGMCYGMRVVWAGDYADKERGKDDNLYHIEKVSLNNVAGRVEPNRLRYVVNHDKKEFVDVTKIAERPSGLHVHPLPLLTAEGNGQGGGDYFSYDPDGLIGSWARDRISMENLIPAGYAELVFSLDPNA